MNRYDRTFNDLRARGERAFIPFAVAGDPSAELSQKVFETYLKCGADVLEIGYPFSDPIADGPVNQRGAIRAIAAGMCHDEFFGLVRRIRSTTQAPIGVLTYTNSVFHLGTDRYCRRAAQAGIDSVLVADMPPEEAGEVVSSCRAHGLCTVFIVSELTPSSRIKAICAQSSGFIYVVGRLGVTGTQTTVSSAIADTVSRIRAHTRLPLCVGFGLSTPDHISAVCEAGADGAIVGSALVALVEKHQKSPRRLLSSLETLVRSCKARTGRCA